MTIEFAGRAHALCTTPRYEKRLGTPPGGKIYKKVSQGVPLELAARVLF